MIVDAATRSDLELFQDHVGRGGVFALLDWTQTAVGRKALRRRVERPLTDPQDIRETQRAVDFFARHSDAMRLRSEPLLLLERYLRSNIVVTNPKSPAISIASAYWTAVRNRELFREVRAAVSNTQSLLRAVSKVARSVLTMDPPPVVARAAERLVASCDLCRPPIMPTSAPAIFKVDYFFRAVVGDQLHRIMDHVGELDSLRAMGQATANLGWTMPEIEESETFLLQAEDVFHPFVDRPVTNPIDLTGGKPTVFLTGPNMAGKTTYLRSAALLMLLGQLGMSVPAKSARLTPVDVLLTSLNPTDNLREGLSFFFAEVLRVKAAATHLAEGKRCFVLFDEVFKGTNVADALEASAAVILGFARARGSGFIFSSHLVELVESLSSDDRVCFHYFDGRVVDGKAEYSYKVRPGVSEERLGLHLLHEARIPDLIARIGV